MIVWRSGWHWVARSRRFHLFMEWEKDSLCRKWGPWTCEPLPGLVTKANACKRCLAVVRRLRQPGAVPA